MNLSACFNKRWLPLLFSMILMAAFAPFQVNAQHSVTLSTSEEMDADFISRVAHDDAIAVLTTREGSVDLLLTNEMIVLQFTDRFLKETTAEIESSDDLKEASILGDMFRSMISSGVRTLLNNALAIPLHEIENIYYQNDRLVIVNRQGETILEEIEVNDVRVMEDFPRWDAMKFVSEAEKQMK